MRPAAGGAFPGGAWVLVLATTLCLSVGGAWTAGCSDSSGGGGDGGSGATGGSGGAGGTAGEASCVFDGACRPGEACICRECWPIDDCEVVACVDDGECAPDEGCFCADCAEAPECDDYCMPCSEFLRRVDAPERSGRKDLLCEPEALADFEAFEDCICGEACASACEGLCSGSSSGSDCTVCINDNCAAEQQTCGEDVRPDIFCNPVTQEPCAPTEACDRVQPFPGTVSGFFCFPPPNETAICESCNTNVGRTCEAGLTCVDDTGALPATDGLCGRYCCDDEDCGTGVCLKGTYAPAAPDLGVCAEGGGDVPACDVPSASDSGGSCVQLLSP